MRLPALLSCALALGLAATLGPTNSPMLSPFRVESAAAHNNSWAFQPAAIRTRRNNLRFLFNRIFPDWGPHEVRCWGLGPVRFNDGSRGYIHIRCRVESMNVPDFLYHLDRRGRLVTTRVR